MRFGAPPPEPARAPPPPPPRSQLPTLGFLQKRSLTTAGSIAVSAVTSAVIVGAALGLYAYRATSRAPVATETATLALQPAQAATVNATATARAEATAPPAASAAAAPPPLPPGYGRLTVVSAQAAEVYLTGKQAGPANAPLEVRCGTWFLRLGKPNGDLPPTWVGPGKTVRIACQAETTVDPQQSSLVLKRY
ncbi:MAG: hypothetical protein U0359_39015 [Byssovorax sp.]